MTVFEKIMEDYYDDEFLIVDGFNEAIIGIDLSSMSIVYSSKICLDILTRRGFLEDEALEHFYFNIKSANFEDKSPIFVELY
jgi:hypothetical protein